MSDVQVNHWTVGCPSRRWSVDAVPEFCQMTLVMFAMFSESHDGVATSYNQKRNEHMENTSCIEMKKHNKLTNIVSVFL